MIWNKIKIVLDADIIIHFIKGDSLSVLFDIFPEYEYIILDIVYNELDKRGKHIINNFECILKKVSIERFQVTGDSLKEYFFLTSTMGKGESACMVYCKDNNDVLGSSNLNDILSYCKQHNITYLTTLDFLYYAYKKGLMSKSECIIFIEKVKTLGSKLPVHVNDITTYICNVQL